MYLESLKHVSTVKLSGSLCDLIEDERRIFLYGCLLCLKLVCVLLSEFRVCDVRSRSKRALRLELVSIHLKINAIIGKPFILKVSPSRVVVVFFADKAFALLRRKARVHVPCFLAEAVCRKFVRADDDMKVRLAVIVQSPFCCNALIGKPLFYRVLCEPYIFLSR